MKNYDVLIINSYAGSLTIAATQEGEKIRGSYEDGGYGLDIQQENFPKLKFIEDKPWPKQDLRRTVVLAHPPCAAFSAQTAGRGKKSHGVEADKFKCTLGVMEYALSQKCAALAIESVPGALEGARGVHDEFAAKYGYNVFRILQNAVTFGLPQWRPRFWIVFMPKKQRFLEIYHDHEPFRPVGQFLQARPKKSELFVQDVENIEKQRQHFTKKNKLNPRIVEGIFEGEYGFGPIQRILRSVPGTDITAWHDADPYCIFGVSFSSGCLVVVDPTRYVNTLLCTAFWTTRGRPLSSTEYKRIMGFPDDYRFVKPQQHRQIRCYLSRGVCPPVARWIISTVRHALSEGEPPGKNRRAIITTGETADLLPVRSKFLKQSNQLELFS